MRELEHQEAGTGTSVVVRLCQYLSRSGSTPEKFLGSGTVDANGFQGALEGVGIEVSHESATQAMATLDQDGDGTLDATELATRVVEFQRKRRVFTARVLGHVVDFVSRTNTSLTRLFARVDSDGSGALDALELQEALLKLHQDLSEAEVEDLMQELGLRDASDTEGGDSSDSVSCSQLLDKLKLYQSERVADTAKCKSLWAALDQDGDGTLDCGEIQQLAEHLGFRDRMTSDGTFIDTLLSEIKSSRNGQTAFTDGSRDASVSFDELLPWFLNTGK